MDETNTSRIPASYTPSPKASLRGGGALADADLPLPDQQDALDGKRTGLEPILKRRDVDRPDQPQDDA